MEKENLKRLKFWLSALLACSFAVEIFWIRPEHAAVWWQKLAGFHIFLGIAGGLFLMGLAKALGKFWLYRKADYYD